MTDKPTYTECEECGHSPHQTSDYCGSCGAEDPWVEGYKYDMDDVEFPVIIEFEMYNDNYELWRSFCNEVFGVYELKENQIANFPKSFPRMKYTVFMTYWKITKSDVKGPFLSRSEARNA